MYNKIICPNCNQELYKNILTKETLKENNCNIESKDFRSINPLIDNPISASKTECPLCDTSIINEIINSYKKIIYEK